MQLCVQILCCVCVLIHSIVFVALLWATSKRKKHKDHRRQIYKRQQDAVTTKNTGLVSIVVPVCGERDCLLQNLVCLCDAMYPPGIELIVAAASQCDRGARAAKKVRNVHVVSAGAATTCSQKVHNMLAGAHAASAEAEFVLFVDDDATPHPHIVSSLVARFTQHTYQFGCAPLLATGMSFDLPAPEAEPRAGQQIQSGSKKAHDNIWATACCAYHALLNIVFSQGERAMHVWGGSMLLKAEDIRGDSGLQLHKRLADGVYSDDLTLASTSLELKKAVVCPEDAIFANIVPADVNRSDWWSYLKRQSFVLDTYYTNLNRTINHCTLLALVLLCAFATWPLLTCAPVLLLSDTASLLVYHLPSSEIHERLLNIGTASAPIVSFTLVSAWCKRFLRSLCDLWCSLHVNASINTAVEWRSSNSKSVGVADVENAMHSTSTFQLAFGLAATFAALPITACSALLQRTITWAGVTYKKERGRIQVIHSTFRP